MKTIHYKTQHCWIDSEDSVEMSQSPIQTEEFNLVDISRPTTDIDLMIGLTEVERRELRGVVRPTGNMHPKSRIGPNGALQVQADNFKEKLDAAIDRRDNTEDSMEITDLEGRIMDLREAVDICVRQREVEEVREQQEEDVSRYQKVKEYVKKNLTQIGVVNSILIGVASIITTVVVAGRTAIYKGASATYNFASAVYDTLKKIGKAVGPYLGPIFTAVGEILSTLIKLGGKGLSWLANNLWVLVVFIFWFLWDYYKERRRRRKT